MSTWESLRREHMEIFTRVNLLEKALIDLPQKNMVEQLEKPQICKETSLKPLSME